MGSSTKTARAREAPPPTDQTVRQRLLQAAVTVFTRKGYAAASVHEIVEAAGVTKPVLYYYFRNKEGIFLELLQDGSTRFRAMIARSRKSTRGGARDRITALCRETIAIFFENLDVIRMMNAIYYGPPQGAPSFDIDKLHELFSDTVRGVVKEGIKNGEFIPGDVQAMTLAIGGAVNITMEANLFHPRRAPGPEVITRVLDVVFQGMIPQNRSQEARS